MAERAAGQDPACTGAMLLVTALNRIRRRSLHRRCSTLCRNLADGHADVTELARRRWYAPRWPSLDQSTWWNMPTVRPALRT